MFHLKHYILAAILLIISTFFGVHFLREANGEFLIYIVVILIVFFLIAGTYHRVRYPFSILSGLVFWAILHLAGGGILWGDTVLYEKILIPLSSNYPILRYDQVVHAWGFGISTLIIYYLMSRLILPKDMNRISVGIIIITAGCGLGALNENIEFLLTVFLPKTGIGGYINTSLDLCSNLLGALIAYCFVRFGLLSMND